MQGAVFAARIAGCSALRLSALVLGAHAENFLHQAKASSTKGAEPRVSPRFCCCPPARLVRRLVGLLTCGFRSLRPSLRFRGGHQRLRLPSLGLVCDGLDTVCDGLSVDGLRINKPCESGHTERRLFPTQAPSHPCSFLVLRPLCRQLTRDIAASPLLRPLRPPTLALGLRFRCAGKLSCQPPFLNLPLRLGFAVALAAARWPKPNSTITPPITRH